MLARGLKLVFCGTAAGAASARKRAYYAGPGNRFWPMLTELRLVGPKRDRRSLHRRGIGLTDLVKHASGADQVLRRGDFRRWRFIARISRCRPRVLAFNGKKAASVFLGISSVRLRYGPQRPRPGWPRMVVLPSTSRAANAHWDPAPWRALPRLLRR